MTLQSKFAALAAHLRAHLLERDEVVDAMIRCAVAGRHMLLLGEPGTAKSLVVDTLTAAIGGQSFSYLLTRHTEPAEMFGPVDVKAMADSGRLTRRMAGYLPEAHVVFLDEAFKGSSAILNTMLGVLNERTISDDGRRLKIPLRFAVLASNEVPDEGDHSVEAFYDRVLVRLHVAPLEDVDNFTTLVRRQLPAPATTPLLEIADLDEAKAQSRAIDIDAAAVDALFLIRGELRKAGVIVSDRRWLEVADYLRAHAWLAGRQWVRVDDIAIAAPCLWSRLDQRPVVDEILLRCAPSHEQEAREVRQTLDEQLRAIKVAKAEPKREAMAALGEIGATLDDIDGDIDHLHDLVDAVVIAGLRAMAKNAREQMIAAMVEKQKGKS